MPYEVKTRKNYDFYECSSAFQKAIRRGEEKLACFFAFELVASGYSKYIWRRIFVITSEDIGLADDNMPVKIKALHNMWEYCVDKNPEESSMIILQAVVMLSRSKKSRLIDHLKIWALKSGFRPEVPDYALDVHTRRGKIKGRGLKFFLSEGRKVINELIFNDENSKEYESFFVKYLKDFDDKKVTECGYDEENIFHKNIKELGKWRETRGGNLF